MIKKLGIKNIILIFLAGILLIISTFDTKKNEATKIENTISNMENIDLEYKLEKMIEGIAGVKSAKVLITYKDTGEKYLISNTDSNKEIINEKDAQGGLRSVENQEKNVNYLLDGNDNPYVISEKLPKVLGVFVIYTGDKELKKEIADAVKILTDVEYNNIKIITNY